MSAGWWGFSLSFRLQAVWAAILYCSVMWQWSCRVGILWLFTYMIPGTGFVYATFFWCLQHCLWISKHSLYLELFFLQWLKEVLSWIGAMVFNWWLSLTITPRHNVAVTSSLMLLCLLSVTLCEVKLRSLNLGDESLKLHKDDVWGWAQFVKVILFLPSLGIFTRTAVHPISWQSGLCASLFPRVTTARQTVTDMFVLWILGLIIQWGVKFLDSCIVGHPGLLTQQQIDPRNISILNAEPVYIRPFILVKDVDGLMVLSLNLPDLRDGCGSFNPYEVETIMDTMMARSVNMVCAGF